MKRKKLILVLIPVITVFLEILPFGAVLNFATPQETVRQTYSYFDLTPYGYANFGPLLTAVLTCVLLVIAFLYIFKDKQILKIAINAVSLIAFALSLTPLIYGISNFSVVGALISISLFTEFFISVGK